MVLVFAFARKVAENFFQTWLGLFLPPAFRTDVSNVPLTYTSTVLQTTVYLIAPDSPALTRE